MTASVSFVRGTAPGGVKVALNLRHFLEEVGLRFKRGGASPVLVGAQLEAIEAAIWGEELDWLTDGGRHPLITADAVGLEKVRAGLTRFLLARVDAGVAPFSALQRKESGNG